MKFQRAFTLIELLVVISVIAVLTTMGVANFSSAIKKSRDAVRKSELAEISQALMMFRADWGSYPIENKSIDDPNAILSFNDGSGDHNIIPDYLRQFPIDEARDAGSADHYFYKCLSKITATTTTSERCVDFSICAKLEVPSVSGANSQTKEPTIGADGSITGKCTDTASCEYFCMYSP